MTKRNVFISFYQGDRAEVDEFVDRWDGVFTPKALGIARNDTLISSNNPEYVMNRIREKYLKDSTVTIVLVGSCTHGRRYVDWEIKSSLRKGTYTPNGLLGIILPGRGAKADLPPRFAENWSDGHQGCYARYWQAPRFEENLRGWIEDAHEARTTRAHLIKNSAEMMKNSRECNIHKVTH